MNARYGIIAILVAQSLFFAYMVVRTEVRNHRARREVGQ